MIYFTSDTHFGSQRTLELSRRPFKDTKEMDKTILDNFNSILTEDDVLYHLGDFGDYEMVSKINCPVCLILGNYEEKDITMEYDDNVYDFCHQLRKEGFESIERTKYISMPHPETMEFILFNLVHEPSKCIYKTNSEQTEKNVFNLYGHIHGRQMVRRYGMDVGVDCHHFRPVSMKDIWFYYDAIKKHYDNEVFDD